ncbi:hypothetical protein [Thalassotalea agarivorans]|uniref:Uncharacterized protein n=1 Tax=Thalassotalea agarivorans TaxID=349064 RepID=A0A1I0C092_THASX|nr:hypothetical protein [Thalassotalea agarivorans]SET12384.1 hypothetical protein SAMN05660429_01105 [Thalassotalea agarivorans]
MEDYIVIAVIAAAILLMAFLTRYIEKESLVDNGDYVIIRGTLMSRLFDINFKRVLKTDIIKIQIAGNTVSLFNKSDNAYDIFLYGETVNELINISDRLFPNAKTIEFKC